VKLRASKHCRPGRRHRLFWHVYLHGLLLTCVVAAAVTGISLISQPDPRWHWRPEAVVRVLAAQLEPAAADPEALQEQVDRLQAAIGGELAVYAAAGGRLVVAGEAPPAPLDGADVDRLGARGARFRRGRTTLFAAWVDPGHGAYLLFDPGERRAPWRFALGVLVVLGALALASAPRARAIARPLEHLAATSRELADGNLSARTGMDRNDEVGALARAIDQMASRLEQRLLAERELLANVSHELRTPLARLRVALELCAEPGTDPETVRRHLAGIAQDAEELERLVADILDAARLDLAAGSTGEGDGGLRLQPVALAPGALLREAAERFAKRYPGHALEVGVPDALPMLTGDPALLRRVLDNLLDNAAKYSDPEHPVVLAARADPADTPELVAEVRDQGIGVPEQDLPRLFDPFFRTDRSRARGAGGVGLGLTLCRRIVEAHRGRISAEPNPPRGLVVRFTLPCDSAEDPASGPPHSSRS